VSSPITTAVRRTAAPWACRPHGGRSSDRPPSGSGGRPRASSGPRAAGPPRPRGRSRASRTRWRRRRCGRRRCWPRR
jgi:hypothetical protein